MPQDTGRNPTTELAKLLKTMRINANERLLEMAGKLDISVAFLSAVETGRKEPPIDFVGKLASAYHLDEVATARLNKAADSARKTYRISPRTTAGRETVALLARRIDELTGEQMDEIRRILGTRD